MRIGYLSQPGDGSKPADPVGSIELWTWEVARRVARSCEVLVAARRDKSQSATEECEGVRYVRFSPAPILDRVLSAAVRRVDRLHNHNRPGFASSVSHLLYATRCARAFRANACDVVHIHNFSQFVPVVRRINPQAKIVLHMHADWLIQLDKKLIDARLRQADVILGCSEYVSENIRARFPQCADRCMTVYNGVDAKEFHPNGDRPNASGGGQVVFIGRISPEKGLHVLLEAFERVVARRPDARLEIIGPSFVPPIEFIVKLSDDPMVQGLSRFYTGNYAGYLQARVNGGPLEGRVTFAGVLPRHMLPVRLREADVFVFPSVASEMLGISALEAMAAELPVVASRICGLPEVVQDGTTGLLVKPNDPSALAEAVLRLLDDAPLARAMGRAGRQRVEQMFSWESITEKLRQWYATLCSCAHGRNGYGDKR